MPIYADYWKARRSLLRVASCGTRAEVTDLAARAVIDLEVLLQPSTILKKEVVERRGSVTPDILADEVEQLARAIGDLSPECAEAAKQSLRGYRDRLAKGYGQVACAAALVIDVVDRTFPMLAA